MTAGETRPLLHARGQNPVKIAVDSIVSLLQHDDNKAVRPLVIAGG